MPPGSVHPTGLADSDTQTNDGNFQGSQTVDYSHKTIQRHIRNILRHLQTLPRTTGHSADGTSCQKSPGLQSIREKHWQQTFS